MSTSKTKSKKSTKLEEKLINTKPKFEPGKNYKWQPNDEFTLNGEEFSYIYNYFRAKLPEAQATVNAFQVFQNIFEAGISEGTIVEAPDDAVAK